MTVALICGLSLTSCKDDNESGVANAVIVSTRAIEFPNTDAVPVTVNVTADGDWSVEAPEWLSVTPSKGVAGRTEVTIEASDNTKGNAPDRPRKYKLNFKGSTILGAYAVTVQQAGDKYRDLEPMAIADLGSLEDDEAAMLSGVTVVANGAKGVVVTDGSNFAYTTKVNAETGKKVEIIGSKFEADNFAYIVGESIAEQGAGTLPTLTAEDITSKLDSYQPKTQTVVKATGAYDGTIVKVEGTTNDVQIVDADKSIDLNALKGHQIEVTGIYAGTASPVVKIYATSIVDLGLNEVIYFQDDFEWLATDTDILTYVNASGQIATDNVGGQYLKGAYNPTVNTIKSPDGETVGDMLLKKGYNFYSTSDSQARKSLGLSPCYLKMAVTTYTVSLALPKMAELGNGTEGVHVSFDWTPMTDGGKAVWDKTEIAVEVKTNGNTTYIPVDPVEKTDGLDGDVAKTPYSWTRVDIVLDEPITKDTRIELRNADPNYPQTQTTGVKMRWFLDNIKVYKPKN